MPTYKVLTKEDAPGMVFRQKCQGSQDFLHWFDAEFIAYWDDRWWLKYRLPGTNLYIFNHCRIEIQEPKRPNLWPFDPVMVRTAESTYRLQLFARWEYGKDHNEINVWWLAHIKPEPSNMVYHDWRLPTAEELAPYYNEQQIAAFMERWYQ